MSVFTAAEPAQVLGTGLADLPRVNLLPPEIGEKQRFRKVQLGLGAVLVGAVAVVGVLYLSASSSVDEAQVEVEAAQTTQAALRREVASFANVTAVYEKSAAAQVMLVEAMGQEVRYSRFLNDLSLTIPEDVWVTESTFTQVEVLPTVAAPATATAAGEAATPTPSDPLPASPAASIPPSELGSVTMTGVAFSHDDVAVWLDTLADQTGYANAYLTSSEEVLVGPRALVEWSTTVVLTPEALSNRFVDPAGG